MEGEREHIDLEWERKEEQAATELVSGKDRQYTSNTGCSGKPQKC